MSANINSLSVNASTKTNDSKFWSIVTALAAVFAVIIAIAVYVENKKWYFYRYLADIYYEILKVEFEHRDFLNHEKTQKYKEIWPSNSKEYMQYETFARMCWAHAEDIYSIKFLHFGFKKYFRRIYACTFEKYRRLHGVWFQNNTASFVTPGFVEFIKFHQWRNYLDPHTADRIRWENIVYDYEGKVLSPFLPEVNNPLYDYIDNLDAEKYKVVADIGCGHGKLVEILSRKFENVYGIDYSDNMLEIARKRCSLTNVIYKRMDMTNLKDIYDKIDIAFSVNSILPRDPKDTPIMLREIYRTLKPGGLFIAILPSFDTILYLKDLWYKHNVKKLGSELKSKWMTWREFNGRRKLDVHKHLYADDFSNVQRFICESEIEPLLNKAGFDLLKKEKVTYPWELCQKYNYDYFPGEDNIWDWFIVARKKKRS